MALRKKREEEPLPPPTSVVNVPILPTEVQIGRLDAGPEAYAVITLSTILTSGTFVMDRGQTARVAGELMKLAEKLPREKKLEVPPGGLVVPS